MKSAALISVAVLGLAGCVGAEGSCGDGLCSPMTMPPADGRDATVTLAPGRYDVMRQTGQDGIRLRVTRMGRDFDYSEGALAFKAALAYCDGFHRGLREGTGRFSLPNAWVFDGDCV